VARASEYIVRKLGIWILTNIYIYDDLTAYDTSAQRAYECPEILID